MQKLTRQQLALLFFITLFWGFNWPVMKLGISGYPPLSFRTLCMWLGLPLLALVLRRMKVPFGVPRAQWRELAWLTVTNMLVWHALIIVALRSLPSGRAAILGYTMPVFSAVMGALWFGNRLLPRAWAGVAAAAAGVLLLLWHEFTVFSGRPWGVLMALTAAATWALGTQLMRRTRMTVPTLTISFWMTALTTVSMTLLSVVFESSQWAWPSGPTWAAIVFNAVLIFAFAQAAWFSLARDLPPVASSLSVMLIPVLGVFSGAWVLGEVIHWQDWSAMALMIVAIGSVLLPARSR
jgi:drug/metabolite transporter (DMT)-like permease